MALMVSATVGSLMLLVQWEIIVPDDGLCLV